VFGSLFIDHYALVDDERYVTGRFNSHQASLLLLHADEAFWAGDKKSVGRLRSLITGDAHFVEYKGYEAIRIANYMRLLVTGDADWLVPAGFEERRFAVIKVSDAHKQDHKYFAAIDKEMKNGGREALLHHLLNFDLSTVNLRVIPRTAALFEQQVHSATTEQKWWLDTLQRGKLPMGVVSDDTKNACAKPRLFASYVSYAKRAGISHKSTETTIGMFLHKYVGPKLDTKRVEFKGGRERFFFFPSLAECRVHFAKKMQQEIAWEDPKEDWENEQDPI
jgi:hypothetical protein